MSFKATTRSTSTRPKLSGLKDRGVVWWECQSCGQPWPFPKGMDVTDAEGRPQIMQREWLCGVCCNTELAALKRTLAKRTEQISNPLKDMDV